MSYRARGAVLLLATLAAAERAPAQAPAPFSHIEIGAAGGLIRSDDRLRDWWRPGPGALLRLSTPFYLGSVSLAAEASRFRALQPGEQPNFRALVRVAEWNAERGVGRGARVFAGVQAGSLDMSFVDPPTESGNLNENEFLVGFQAGASGRLWGGVGATVLASRRRVLTHVPIHLSTASVGLSYLLPTPAWLRDALR